MRDPRASDPPEPQAGARRNAGVGRSDGHDIGGGRRRAEEVFHRAAQRRGQPERADDVGQHPPRLHLIEKLPAHADLPGERGLGESARQTAGRQFLRTGHGGSMMAGMTLAVNYRLHKMSTKHDTLINFLSPQFRRLGWALLPPAGADAPHPGGRTSTFASRCRPSNGRSMRTNEPGHWTRPPTPHPKSPPTQR